LLLKNDEVTNFQLLTLYLGAFNFDQFQGCKFSSFLSQPEYASVGYMAKRIQMRKNRFLALQKMAEQKKSEMVAAQAAINANNASMNDVGPQDMHGIPKQTVSYFCVSLKVVY
jgi:hypothetical protein